MVRSVRTEDRDWVRRFITEGWSAEVVAVHGVIYRPHELPGFVAEQVGDPVGLLTYQVAGDACEIITLDSTRPGMGGGTALTEAVRGAAAACAGGRRPPGAKSRRSPAPAPPHTPPDTGPRGCSPTALARPPLP